VINYRNLEGLGRLQYYVNPCKARSILEALFNRLTGGACASPVKKIAPPAVSQTCPPKFYLTFTFLCLTHWSYHYIIIYRKHANYDTN